MLRELLLSYTEKCWIVLLDQSKGPFKGTPGLIDWYSGFLLSKWRERIQAGAGEPTLLQPGSLLPANQVVVLSLGKDVKAAEIWKKIAGILEGLKENQVRLFPANPRQSEDLTRLREKACAQNPVLKSVQIAEGTS